MWELVAAELPAPVDNTSSYLVFAGVVMTALTAFAIEVIRSRKDRTEPSPPAPIPTSGEVNGTSKIRERIAVVEAEIVNLKKVDEDTEDTVDMIDRRVDRNESRLDQALRFLDRNHPGWR